MPLVLTGITLATCKHPYSFLRRGDTALERQLKERDAQINELLVEGERMAQEQLKTNTILKKLRAKEKEQENLVKTSQQRVDSLSAELAKVRGVLTTKEEEQRQHADALGQLTRAVQRQEKVLEKTKSDLDAQTEKARSLQVSV